MTRLSLCEPHDNSRFGLPAAGIGVRLAQTGPTTMKTTYPMTGPRRRSKFFADGSALVAVKGGGTFLIESQPQYKTAGPKAKTGKPRRRRLPNVLTASTK